jgi:hypothetical protein
MNALLIALTMSLTGTEGNFEGSSPLAAELPLQMSLFDVEVTVEAPAPSFPALVVAFELPSYSELLGNPSFSSSAVIDGTETRPWLTARPASPSTSSLPWLKDWMQR